MVQGPATEVTHHSLFFFSLIYKKVILKAFYDTGEMTDNHECSGLPLVIL